MSAKNLFKQIDAILAKYSSPVANWSVQGLAEEMSKADQLELEDWGNMLESFENMKTQVDEAVDEDMAGRWDNEDDEVSRQDLNMAIIGRKDV